MLSTPDLFLFCADGTGTKFALFRRHDAAKTFMSNAARRGEAAATSTDSKKRGNIMATGTEYQNRTAIERPTEFNEGVRETLIEGLNEDLSGELQAMIMYLHYAAMLTGPYRPQLRSLFQSEIADEQRHAQFLSDKIAILGGKPTTMPRPIPDADTPREMLLNILDAEKQAIADYNRRVMQAEEFGDMGLKVDLEDQVSDETRHKEEVERILADWHEWR